MKFTKQKDVILTAVRAMRNHPTAGEIYRKLRKEYPRLSLGTVYRNLNAFAQAGDIRKVTILGGGDRFDYRTEQHEHILCDHCGQVFDVEAEVEIKLQGSESVLGGYVLFLHGLCSQCRAEAGASRPLFASVTK